MRTICIISCHIIHRSPLSTSQPCVLIAYISLCLEQAWDIQFDDQENHEVKQSKQNAHKEVLTLRCHIVYQIDDRLFQNIAFLLSASFSSMFNSFLAQDRFSIMWVSSKNSRWFIVYYYYYYYGLHLPMWRKIVVNKTSI